VQYVPTHPTLARERAARRTWCLLAGAPAILLLLPARSHSQPGRNHERRVVQNTC